MNFDQIFDHIDIYIVLLYDHQQQICNKQTNITLLIFVYYVYLLHVLIQLDHHEAIFMKCITRY
jgi:hypothetical protein